MPVTMDYSSLSGAFQEFSTFFSSVLSFITSNWIIAAVVIIPLVAALASVIISFIRSR